MGSRSALLASPPMSGAHTGTVNMAGVGAGLAASRSFHQLSAASSVPNMQRNADEYVPDYAPAAPLVAKDQQPSSSDSPATAEEVLLMVRQMRAAAGADALDTLDLCYKHIETVPDDLAAMIQDDVVRLALGYNLITHLPDNFASLASLRYLNIRVNDITDFPACVCEMPNLEILDLSRNKIGALPHEPGRLLGLRVLSVNGNRLARLPSWVAKMKQLRILKLDNNPLVWPPPHISKMPIVTLPKPTSSGSGALAERDKAKRFEDRQMLVWIAKLRSWINDPANAEDGLLAEQQTVRPKALALEPDAPSVAPLSSDAHTREDSARETPSADNRLLPPLVPVPPSDEAGTSMVAGDSSSGESTGGAMSSGSVPIQNLPLASPFGSEQPLHMEPASDAKQHARNNSHSILLDSSNPQQAQARKSLKSKQSLPDLRLADEAKERAPDESEPTTATPPVAAKALATPPNSAGRRLPRPMLASAAMQSTRSTPGATNELGLSTASGSNTSHFHALPPSFSANAGGGGLRKLSLPTVGATQAAADAAAAALAARSNYASGSTPPRFENGHGRMPSDRGEGTWPASPTGAAARNPADQERNSYFRRLSTLPPSTVAKTAPVPVLKFVDGTRGVLFALSQIHAAISQFMTPVIDERIAGQFHRVLDISNGSIVSLINSLDRFDTLSRRGAPDAGVIRGVLTTCKESVVTFRKLVSVLQLQLRALQSSSDVRYARTLLLMLVGSMAEVSNSWTAMAPLVEAVQPYLTQQDAPAPAAAPPAANPSHPTARLGSIAIKNSNTSSTPSLPSIAESAAPARTGPRSQAVKGPSRRRHAGSFSAQDLAQGAAMAPSAGNPPPFDLGSLQAASVYGTPAKRAAGFQRSESMPNNDVIASATPKVRGGHSVSGPNTPARPHRLASNASSAALEASTPRSTPAGAVSSPIAHRSRPSLPNVSQLPVAESRIVVDDHLLSMVDQITQLSAQVWSMLFTHLRATGVGADSDAPWAEDDADAKPNAHSDAATGKKLHELHEMAHATDAVTMQLRSTYLLVRQEETGTHERANSAPATLDAAATPAQAAIAKLFDESHQFVRAIVATSTLMKSISETHEFPRDLRRSLGEIAQACSNLTVYLLWLSPPS